MSNLQERLKQFINMQNLSVLSFETRCGLSVGAVSKMTDKTYARTLNRIAAAFPQLNMGWLKTGEGKMLNNGSASPVLPGASDASVASIPLLDLDASAGFSLVDAVEGGSARTLTLPHCDGAMSVRGHSMEPEIHDGDIAAFVMIPSAASIRPDGVYIVQYDDEDGFNHITIKRTKRSPLGERYVRLASVNDEYGYEDVPLASISRVAKVRYTISQLSY